MSQQIIFTGVGPAFNSNADPLRVAFTKANDNFTELYAGIAGYVTSGTLDGYFADPSTNAGFVAAAWITDLGLGTMSLQNANAVAITGGTISGVAISSITDLAVADGGTGASTAAAARTNLGLVINTDVAGIAGNNTFTGINTFTSTMTLQNLLTDANFLIRGAVGSNADLSLWNNNGGVSADRWVIRNDQADDHLKFYGTGGLNLALDLSRTGDAILLKDFTIGGILNVPKTITPAGTTGAQIINKIAGSVNFGIGATSLIVTNSTVTANSIIQCTVGSNDATLFSVNAVAGAGTFTMNGNAAATAETRVDFLVIN